MSVEDTPSGTDRDSPERTDGAGFPWTPAPLLAIRRDSRRRAVAVVAAAAVGLGLAWVHWLGLFAAGAAVGLVSRTLPRAVAAGICTGTVALALTVLASPSMGTGEFLALSPPAYVAVAAGLLGPGWGALVRGVV
ncbi:hypothetical protein [Saliphagus sp. LR7]|uniref:hypothetical protein n=1 Tax=Saliphagus sp. LR7 TaxID=2282654 RepID=UPI000DF77FD1|nr:hypothetical protein [Saliphagus sp. LR7]